MKILKVTLPIESIATLDKAVEQIGFKSRENFVEVSVKRLLDRYRVLLKSADL